MYRKIDTPYIYPGCIYVYTHTHTHTCVCVYVYIHIYGEVDSNISTISRWLLGSTPFTVGGNPHCKPV